MRASLKHGFIFDVGVIGVIGVIGVVKVVKVVKVVRVVDDGKPALQVGLKRVVVFDVGVLDLGMPAILQVRLK